MSGQGETAAEISNGIVRLFRQYYGRGPVKAKTFLMDAYVLTVLEDTLTTAEATLVESGREALVRDFRLAFQTEMTEAFEGIVERATGRRVVTYQSQIAFQPDICFEAFVLDGVPDAIASDADADTEPD